MGFKDFHARRLVETAGHIITYLLARQAGDWRSMPIRRKIFCKLAEGKISRPIPTPS